MTKLLSDKVITTGLLALSVYGFIMLILSQPVHAIELLSYKDTATNTTVISKQAVESAWASSSPVCLKEGAKLIGVNKAFKAARLGYRDCSNSPKRARIHKAQGISVTVFKLSELPMDMIKTIKKAQ